MKKILFYFAAGLGIFLITSTIFHFPMYNAIIFVPLAVCLFMVFFMMNGHGSEDGKVKNHNH